MDEKIRRRLLAVLLATLFLGWGAVLTFAQPAPQTPFSFADAKR